MGLGFLNVLFELSIKGYFSRPFPDVTPNLITTNRRKIPETDFQEETCLLLSKRRTMG